MECKEQRSGKEGRRGSAKHALVGSLESSLKSGGETYLRARDTRRSTNRYDEPNEYDKNAMARLLNEWKPQVEAKTLTFL